MAAFVCQSKLIYDNATPGYKTNAENPSGALDVFSVEITNQMTQIEDFFVSDQGSIKGIYDAINRKEFPYNEVLAVCTKTALNEYKDYFNGMRQFIDKVYDLKAEDQVNKESVEKMITKVVNVDKEYIDGLFEKKGKAKLDIAVNCLETMVELMDEMKASLEDAGNIVEREANVDPEYQSYAKRVCLIAMESLRYFYMRIICEAFSCYSSICKSMEKRTPVSGEVETPKFQLF